MQLDDRSTQLMQEVIRNPNTRSKDLAEKYALSRRQIGYSFDKINDWLKASDLPVIEKNRQGVFIVNTKLLTIFQNKEAKRGVKNYIASETERVDLISLLLLGRSEELSLIHLTSALTVSKNTILSDLKVLQKHISPYGLVIRYTRQSGYRLEGLEFEKRRLLLDVVYRILKMYNGINWITLLGNITEEEIAKLRQRMENVENKLHLTFTDEKMESTIYTLCLILRRIKQEKEIGSFHIDYEELSDTNEYKAVEELLVDLGEISQEERLFITLQLLTANVSSSAVLTNESIPALLEAIFAMLNQFEVLSCITLQDKTLLAEKILQHTKPAYYRIKYKLTPANSWQENFLRETFQQEFKDLHHLVKNAMRPLEELIGCAIPETESSYITMLVGGWIKRQGDSLIHKIKALVVCPNGVSISKLLQITLKELFPEFIFMDAISVREFLHYPHDYDLVFSSVYLQTDKNLFIVNPVLEQKEKSRIRKQVMQELYGYAPTQINMEQVLQIVEENAEVRDRRKLYKELQEYFTADTLAMRQMPCPLAKDKPNLSDLIVPNRILLGKVASDWEEAIRLAAEPLLNCGSIERQYTERIIARYQQYFPYIIFGTDIAIPHGIPEDGVHRAGMSLVRLDEGVTFSAGRQVRLVVLVAAVDRDLHLRALLQLSKLAENKKDIKAIYTAKSAEQIHHILENYRE